MAVMASVVPALTQERALPDLQTFLQEARKHVQTDERLLSQYTYRETRREVHLSKLGKVTTGPTQVYEVYPGAGPVPTYRRLIEVDGRPRSQQDLDRDDLEHRRKLEEAQARRARETPAERARRLERRQRAQAKYERSADDLLRVYRFTMVARQLVDGHPAIAIDFEPRADAAPVTDDGKIMTKVRGRAWISEDDFQLVRVDAETVGDVSYGWGVLGKLYSGTTASVERRKINNEVWLPAVVRVNAAGRAVIRRFQLDTVIQYSDYRKFGVDTDTEFLLLKKP